MKKRLFSKINLSFDAKYIYFAFFTKYVDDKENS